MIQDRATKNKTYSKIKVTRLHKEDFDTNIYPKTSDRLARAYNVHIVG